jgi:hypothetical protein
MTPQQAIDTANENGVCKLGQHTFLFKTSEAAKEIKIKDQSKPYTLVFDLPNWDDEHGVTNAKDSRLIQACGVQK